MRRTLLALLALALLATAGATLSQPDVVQAGAERVAVRDARAASCKTDSTGYCTVSHALGVKPEVVLVTPRIPKGYKSYILSVVQGTETASSFRVKAVYHDGKAKAKNSLFFYFDANGSKLVNNPDPDPEPGPGVCTNPDEIWPTDDGGGPVDGEGTGDGRDYYGGPNLWNDNGTVTQSMGVCSYDSWYVEATARNLGDGAVLSYPNIHKDWHDWSNDNEPRLDTFDRIPTKFAHKAPDVGIWNFAFDVWINGVGNGPGTTELMIWTEYKGQRPAGDVRDTVTVGGTEWDLWATDDDEIVSYVAKTPTTSGQLDLSAFTNHLMSEGLIAADSTLGQIGYGVEIVDTAGSKQRFDVTDFQVDAF